MTRIVRSRGAALEELRAEASHAAQRLALYRRKVLGGRSFAPAVVRRVWPTRSDQFGADLRSWGWRTFDQSIRFEFDTVG